MRLGIIGVGRVAWLLENDPLRQKPCTHVGAWGRLSEVELVSACDTDPERLQAFKQCFPEVRCYADFREMLRREQLDLLSVCAYADSRCEMVEAACEAGVRGIWAEKSIANSLTEAKRICEAVSRNGVKFAMSFPRRWNLDYQWVESGLKNGDLGKVEAVTAQFSGNLIHTGTHAMDVLRMWLGDPIECTGWVESEAAQVDSSGYRYGAPGSALAQDVGGFGQFQYSSGCRALIIGHSKRYFRFEFEIVTDECLIRIGNTQREHWVRSESPHFQDFIELKRQQFATNSPVNVFEAVARSLVDALNDGSPCNDGVRCSEVDGLKALEMALAIHESSLRGHIPLDMRRFESALSIDSR